MECYAFDVDGVLLDVSERLRVAEERVRYTGLNFWDVFFDEELLNLDRPRPAGEAVLRERVSHGSIVIITGRPQRIYGITLNQLIKFFNVTPVRIYMRRNGDYRPSYIVKAELIKHAVSDGFEIIEYHDDDEDVLRAVRSVNPDITLYLHVGNSYRVVWRGIRKLDEYLKG